MDPGVHRHLYHRYVRVQEGHLQGHENAVIEAAVGVDASLLQEGDGGDLSLGRDRPGTYFNGKKKYEGLLPTVKRLKQLEDENGRLRPFFESR